MAYWLLKSEPNAFSWNDLQSVADEPWNGIRNYQARNNLRQMQIGDQAFFYHSNTSTPGIVGIAEVCGLPEDDELQFDPNSRYFDPKSSREKPRWTQVQVRALRPLERFVSLQTLRNLPEWETSPLTAKGSRLSVMPVTETQWQAVLRMAEDSF